MVFSSDLKDAAESIERRLGFSVFQKDGTETEKARDSKLELTAGLGNYLQYRYFKYLNHDRV